MVAARSLSYPTGQKSYLRCGVPPIESPRFGAYSWPLSVTNTDLNKPSLEGRSDQPVFQAVMLYENFAAGLDAWRFCKQLVRKLDSAIQQQMWNFHVLGIHEVRNAAVHAATKADMVIISVSGHSELPANVRDWLDLWLWLGEPVDSALVTLFDSPGAPAVATTCTYLQSMARRARIEFFSPWCQIEAA